MTTPITTTTEHWRCDCVPNLGPAHCHGCDDESQSPVAWVDCPANRPTTPELDRAVAARVTKRLTDAWGWLPDEPEAVTLGANFARSAYLLVAGTRTTPDNLLDALIDGPVVAAPTVKPGRDEVPDRKPVVGHPDAEASNVLAGHVIVRMWPYMPDGHTPFSARYGIAGDFLAWLDEHRPAWRETKTIAQVRAEALREAQQVIAGEDSIAWARAASGSHIMLDHAMGLLDDLIADEEAGK